MLILALAVLLPIGQNPSLLDNLLQHSAHTLAVGGRQLIALVQGARSGQGVAIFHRPIEHVGTRALQAEGAALLGDVLFHKHTQALVAIAYSNGVVLVIALINYLYCYQSVIDLYRLRISLSFLTLSILVLADLFRKCA